MATKKNNTLLGKLNTKKVEFLDGAASDNDAAAYHEAQVGGLKASAADKSAKALAVGKALAILNEAGIEV